MSNICVNGSFEVGKALKICENRVCFDVGSHIGGVAYTMLDNLASEVHLFEPTPNILQISKETLKDNLNKVFFNMVGVSNVKGQLKNVELLACWTMCAENETINLSVSPSGKELQKDKFDVNLITLDDYCEENNINDMGVLKIDVEGYEHRVLLGAKKSIEKFKPVIIIELSLYVDSVGDNIQEFINYLYQMPYEIKDGLGELISKQRMIEQFPYDSSCDVVMWPLSAVN